MATRRTLYSDLLNTWVSRLEHDGLMTAAEKSLVDSDLGIEDFHGVITKMKTVLADGLSVLILNEMDSIQNDDDLLDEEIPTNLDIHKGEVELHREYCYKEFSYIAASGDLCVITTSAIKAALTAGDIADGEWKILERMLLKDVTTIDILTDWSNELAQNKKMVYVLTNLANPDVWRLYSYAYLCHINTSHVEIPAELNYSSTTHFTTSPIAFKTDVLYEQYFEAYHVMNEAKHVEDILSRYLRMYQVLEQFVYRYRLVEIEKANNRNSAFVRNVIKQASKTTGDERGPFIDGFKKVFPNIDTVITAANINPFNAFLDGVYQIKSGEPHTVTKVARIIYAIRNSVVHNKESELHFTYGNVEEYKDGINLMKVLISKMEYSIVETINTPLCPVSYTKEIMPLY